MPFHHRRKPIQMRFHFKKMDCLRLEDNKERKVFGFKPKFTEYGIFSGRGDSTKIFVELGFEKNQ
jgi:hypothetical protein